jgi:hypothetical protein
MNPIFYLLLIAISGGVLHSSGPCSGHLVQSLDRQLEFNWALARPRVWSHLVKPAMAEKSASPLWTLRAATPLTLLSCVFIFLSEKKERR